MRSYVRFVMLIMLAMLLLAACGTSPRVQPDSAQATGQTTTGVPACTEGMELYATNLYTVQQGKTIKCAVWSNTTTSLVFALIGPEGIKLDATGFLSRGGFYLEQNGVSILLLSKRNQKVIGWETGTITGAYGLQVTVKAVSKEGQIIKYQLLDWSPNFQLPISLTCLKGDTHLAGYYMSTTVYSEIGPISIEPDGKYVTWCIQPNNYGPCKNAVTLLPLSSEEPTKLSDETKVIATLFPCGGDVWRIDIP